MEELGIADGEMLAVHVRETRPAPVAAPASRPRPQQQAQAAAGQGARPLQDPETLRLQVLGSPAMRAQLERQQPGLAAVVDNPVAFATEFRNSVDREHRERLERQREVARLNEDPFNIDNQLRIEEIIRQERVMENLQSAMEHNPEGEHAH
jgi:DNA damage-inducible protein 1